MTSFLRGGIEAVVGVSGPLGSLAVTGVDAVYGAPKHLGKSETADLLTAAGIAAGLTGQVEIEPVLLGLEVVNELFNHDEPHNPKIIHHEHPHVHKHPVEDRRWTEKYVFDPESQYNMVQTNPSSAFQQSYGHPGSDAIRATSEKKQGPQSDDLAHYPNDTGFEYTHLPHDDSHISRCNLASFESNPTHLRGSKLGYENPNSIMLPQVRAAMRDHRSDESVSSYVPMGMGGNDAFYDVNKNHHGHQSSLGGQVSGRKNTFHEHSQNSLL